MFNPDVIFHLLDNNAQRRADLVKFLWGTPDTPNNHRSITYFISRQNITSDMLEKLSAFFDVPMEIFFLDDADEVQDFLASHDGNSAKQIDLLNKLLKEKERVIGTLQRHIDLLEKLDKSN